ncbi:MAG: sugar ABC transporter permease [Ruminococcaceae bacterium]|nr:sugar ABC transporter permease [Oscillospiraceae bacterium]
MDRKISMSRTAAPRRRRAASLDKRKAMGGWLFVMPFVIGLILIYFPVIVDSFKYSLSSMTFDKTQGFVIEFVGLENYQEALFVDPKFVQTLTSGIKNLIIDIPSIVIFSLFIAVILNQKVLGRAAFRAIFFIPVICATGLMGSIAAASSAYDDYMMNQDAGITTGALDSGFNLGVGNLTRLFESMKIGTEITDFVVGAVGRISSIIDRCGVQMLILLAALQSISPAIYESCSIDGATTWETFWKITLPMISPMILVATIYTVIDSFTSADNSVMVFITAKYNEAGGNVLSAAMAWIYFAIIILIVLVVVVAMSAFVFYQRRD